jgi:hypothetical protein
VTDHSRSQARSRALTSRDVGRVPTDATATASTDRQADERLGWFAAASAVALAYALYVGRGGSDPIPLAMLTIALLAAGAAVARRRPLRLPILRGLGRLLGFGLAVQFALLFVWPVTDPLLLGSVSDYVPFWLGLAVAAILAALPAFGLARIGWVRLVALALIHLALGVWVIESAPDPHIDLWYMQVDGVRALVEGVNPYLPIYENIHGADTTYYGPGLVENGELTIGFPYPPLSLLLVMPGELLAGDVRYAHLVAIELSALVMAAMRPGAVAAKAALLYLFTPWTFLMAVGGWTEPLVVLLLSIVVLAAVRAPRVLGVALGLLIVVKQYALIGLPLALLLVAPAQRARWRIGWQSIAVAAAITVPFVLWDIDAFSWSTLGSIAGQVFRPDTLTYLAALPGDWGPRLSVVGAVVLLPVAALIAWRAPRTPSGFAISFAFMLMAFFAFSRQGGGNYYFAVIGALCCAVAASQRQPGERGSKRPALMGNEGHTQL